MTEDHDIDLQTASLEDRIAWRLSYTVDTNAPVGWKQHRLTAASIAYNNVLIDELVQFNKKLCPLAPEAQPVSPVMVAEVRSVLTQALAMFHTIPVLQPQDTIQPMVFQIKRQKLMEAIESLNERLLP